MTASSPNGGGDLVEELVSGLTRELKQRLADIMS